MPVPPDPSHSTSDSEHQRRPDGDGLGRAAAAGADRFWQEFSRARTERPRRGRAGGSETPPPQDGEEKGNNHECLEWCPICRSADVLRAAGGPEVRGQIAALQRDSLLALRTLIDAYLVRSGPQAPAPWDEPHARPGDPAPRPPAHPAEPPVQDIPID